MSPASGGSSMLMGDEVLEKLVSQIAVEIKNADGLHMRPAMQFVDLASRFDCQISVSNGQIPVDGKSIMQMSMLAATCGTRLQIRAEGPDAEKAVEAYASVAADATTTLIVPSNMTEVSALIGSAMKMVQTGKPTGA